MRLLSTLLLASLFATCVQGALVITAQETGGNVVFTWSGSLNLSGVTYAVQDINSVAGGINPSVGNFLGYNNPNSLIDLSNPVLTPASVPFGTSGVTAASSFSGSAFGLDGAGRIGIPFNYVSGNALSGSVTYNGATFSSLGLIEGTYNWTLPSTDTIQMLIPEPSTLCLSALGFALLLRRRR